MERIKKGYNVNKFQFRAFICVDSYDSDGNDKEYQFYVYNVSPYGGTRIGFSYDDLCAALDETNYTDEEKEQIISTLEDYTHNEEWYNYDGVVEQFASVRDKNNMAVYDGDIVAYRNSSGTVCETCTVIFERSAFMLRNAQGVSNYLFNCLDGGNIEIIGNIHEKMRSNNDD